MPHHQPLFGRGPILAVLTLTTIGIPCLAQCGTPRTSGVNELVILDPGVNSRGIPDVQVKKDGGPTATIEIPPTLHVHRYYYSGDREFQAPFVAGGPTIVVASHPRTGERLYAEVMLPAGYPIISYDDHNITYVYPTQRVTLHYATLTPQKVLVTYHSGKGIGRVAHEKEEALCQKARTIVDHSKLTGKARDACQASKKITVGVYDFGEYAVGIVYDTGSKLLPLIPGVQSLQSLGEDRLKKGQTQALSESEKLKGLQNNFMKTVR